MNQAEKLADLLQENAIGVTEFSFCLGIDEAVAEELVAGSKKLTASLSRQIEQTFSKPKFWLDDQTETDNQEAQYDLFG
ncbi:hypothetical protein [Reinekea thalattae]|uniref:XRE family transcriptional regulator n=1 Tax=Reinekea thalattae TaxID=2593301 RepID=A0A5C8Z9Q7_9GAMM|nr:hypothetical protein [Reinekea thalattae]TXR53540.1 hypothetical protein FME95_02935 [Reinekea thalattae]